MSCQAIAVMKFLLIWEKFFIQIYFDASETAEYPSNGAGSLTQQNSI